MPFLLASRARESNMYHTLSLTFLLRLSGSQPCCCPAATEHPSRTGMLSGFFFCPLLSFPSSVLLQRSRCTPHLALTLCSCHRGSDSLKGHKIELRRSRQKATERSAEEYWDSKALRPALRPGSSGMGCLSRTVRLVCLQPSCVCTASPLGSFCLPVIMS